MIGYQKRKKRASSERVPLLLGEPAFERNLVSLYLSRCLGDLVTDLEKLMRDHATKPDADPIRNALSYLESPQVATNIPALSFAQEPDEIEPHF